MCAIMKYLFFCAQLIYSTDLQLYLCCCKRKDFIRLFMMEQYSMCIFTLSIHSVDEHLGHFYFWAMVNSAARNMRVQKTIIKISLLLNLYPVVELLDHILVLFFKILSNFHTVFHNDCNNLYSHQQSARVSFYPNPCKNIFCHWIIDIFARIK